MKYLTLILTVLLIGCLDQKPASDKGSAAPIVPRTMLDAQGCTLSKNGGAVTISCSDGSSASFNSVPANLHVREANNTDHPNLIHTGDHTHYYNTDTGHIVGYYKDLSIESVTSIQFEGANCTGNMWTYLFDPAFGNQILANKSGFSSSTGFIVIANPKPTQTFNSYWQASDSSCTNLTQSPGDAPFYVQVNGIQMDNVPMNLTGPLVLEP